MASLFIEYPINTDADSCRKTIDELMLKLQEKYGLQHNRLDEVTCRIEGSGVSGQIDQNDDHIIIEASLGFFMMPMKSLIESEIIKQLDESFE
ncbi:polyhydroxyalkanoic acid system family protein [Marinicella sp. W31]|uniref:polyhydroxyalkanoic acid system family protein n=1 Tax=Marinicella sp. W31 TaxID=3023713 RepID=UPI003757F3C7